MNFSISQNFPNMVYGTLTESSMGVWNIDKMKYGVWNYDGMKNGYLTDVVGKDVVFDDGRSLRSRAE